MERAKLQSYEELKEFMVQDLYQEIENIDKQIYGLKKLAIEMDEDIYTAGSSEEKNKISFILGIQHDLINQFVIEKENTKKFIQYIIKRINAENVFN